MGFLLRLATLVAAGLLWAAPPIHAQATAPGQTAGWVFTPSMGMGGSWDDNVFLVHPDDRPPAEYASPLSPSLSLDFTGRRTQFSSAYHGSWVLYRELGDLNSFDQTLRVYAHRRLTPRLSLTAQEDLAISASTDAVQLAGVPFYRVGTRTNAARGGFEAALAAHTTLRGGYTLRSVAFDPVAFGPGNQIGDELQGGHSHELSLSLARSISSRLSLGGDYTFTRAIVGGQRASDGIVEDRRNIQRGTVNVQYRLSPTLDLSGGIGLAQLGAGLTHDSRIGPTAALGITRRSRHTVVSAAYQRSYVPSFGFGGTFQNEELTGGVLVPFARGRAYVDSRLSWSDNEPIAPGQPSLQTLAASNVVGYRTTRWLNVEGFFVRTQQDTQRAGGQLARNQIGFRLVAAKPLRLR